MIKITKFPRLDSYAAGEVDLLAEQQSFVSFRELVGLIAAGKGMSQQQAAAMLYTFIHSDPRWKGVMQLWYVWNPEVGCMYLLDADWTLEPSARSQLARWGNVANSISAGSKYGDNSTSDVLNRVGFLRADVLPLLNEEGIRMDGAAPLPAITRNAEHALFRRVAAAWASPPHPPASDPSSTVQITEAALREARQRFSRSGAEALHRKLGHREKREAIRQIWASGKYSTRTICAEEECAALGMSYDAARKALRNTPNPP